MSATVDGEGRISIFSLGHLMQRTDHDLGFGFDARYYKERYADLSRMSDGEALQHFLVHGHREQRYQSPVAGREVLIPQLPSDRMALEIGPFGAPQLRGPLVRYADYLSTEELKARAPDHGFDPQNCPHIHYVLGKVPLGAIDDRFGAVFSSHCIEHQPDLVTHLQEVSRVLDEAGRYYLIVPDKRFCFDHFVPESNIGDVLAAYAERRKMHSLRSILMGMSMSTHNEPVRHWEGDHGSPTAYTNIEGAISAATAEYEKSLLTGTYFDVHAWQFTPRGFHSICQDLYRMHLTSLKPINVCAPMWGRTEFCFILEKTD